MTDYTGRTATLQVTAPSGTYTPTLLNFTNGVALELSFLTILSGYLTFTVTDSVAPSLTSYAGNVQINSASPILLLLILPDQTYTPGVAPGVTPLKPTLQEGTPYSLTVYAVDAYYNIVDSFSNTFSVTVDGEIQPPTYFTENGRAFFTVTFDVGGKSGDSSLQAGAGTLNGSRVAYINGADHAYLHLTTPSEVAAGAPFPITATASFNPETPDPLFTGVGGAFMLTATAADSTPMGGSVGGDANPITVTLGHYYGWHTFQRAGTIFLNTTQVSSGGISVQGIRSRSIVVNPTVPHHVLVETPSDIVQAPKTLQITVTVLDQYENPTTSTLYPFEVFLSLGSAHGVLSVTQTATDAYGKAYSIFYSQRQNERITLEVTVKNSQTGATYVTQTKNLEVTIAAAEPGSVINYPNPFNPLRETTSVNYYLEFQSDVEMYIYDAFGRLVLKRKFDPNSGNSIDRAATNVGGASWQWDGRNGEGTVVGNGIYLLKITARGSSGERVFKRRVGVLK